MRAATRGGGTAELYWDDWALRLGRITPPNSPNQLPVDFRIWKYYGDQIELEHDHQLGGRHGAIRVLGYRNHVFTGSFDDAIAALAADPAKNAASCGTLSYYGSSNATAPDLCWVRKPNVKLGIGIDVEQMVGPEIGLFFRGMYSDGRTEVDAFNPADRSVAGGVVAKGTAWGRHSDVAGLGLGASWIRLPTPATWRWAASTASSATAISARPPRASSTSSTAPACGGRCGFPPIISCSGIPATTPTAPVRSTYQEQGFDAEF